MDATSNRDKAKAKSGGPEPILGVKRIEDGLIVIAREHFADCLKDGLTVTGAKKATLTLVADLWNKEIEIKLDAAAEAFTASINSVMDLEESRARQRLKKQKNSLKKILT